MSVPNPTDTQTTKWRPIETGPHDGTEVLVKSSDGDVAVAAWCAAGKLPGHDWIDIDEAAWLRRAAGDWDLFDAFAPQEVEAVLWHPIPK